MDQIDLPAFQGGGLMRPPRHLSGDGIEKRWVMVGQHPALTGTPDTGRQIPEIGAGSGGEIEQAGIFRQ